MNDPGYIIKLQPRKGTSFYLVTLDNGRTLEIHRDVVFTYHLHKDMLLSPDKQDMLLQESQRLFVREKAVALLGRRAHSVQELRRKLLQRGCSPEYIEPLLDELQQRGYLDDRAFARAFIQSHMKSRAWGPRRLHAELIKRGVERTLIEETLASLLEEEQLFARAYQLAQKFLERPRIQRESPLHRKQKLFNFLVRKGYSYDLCRQVVAALENSS